jgi:hypothetical protein
MGEGTDSEFNISYKPFKTQNLPLQNSSCDHRNFDSVNEA